jgi:hypothetical protein
MTAQLGEMTYTILRGPVRMPCMRYAKLYGRIMRKYWSVMTDQLTWMKVRI